METEKSLNARIQSITSLLASKYPELLKFMGEIPINQASETNPEINKKALRDYRDSLEALLKTYSIDHPAEAIA